jgi:hypothetical protein
LANAAAGPLQLRHAIVTARRPASQLRHGGATGEETKNTYTDQCTVGAVRCAAREPSSDGAGSQERLHCELEARPRSGEPRQSPRKAAGPAFGHLASGATTLPPSGASRTAATRADSSGSLPRTFARRSLARWIPARRTRRSRSALPRRRRHFPFAPCAAKPLVSLFQTEIHIHGRCHAPRNP